MLMRSGTRVASTLSGPGAKVVAGLVVYVDEG